jgi:exopolysaccharide production protein ExoQ
MTYLACMFFMTMSTGAFSFVDRMIYGEWTGKPGDKLTLALNLLTIFVSLFLFWWGTHRQRSPRFNRVLPLAVACLLLTSALWSVDPSTTITRGVAYLFIVVGAIGIGAIFDSNEVMTLMALIGGLSAAASLVIPDPGAMDMNGFRGLFAAKNQLGAAMVLGVIGGLHGLRTGDRRWFRGISIIVLCVIVAFVYNQHYLPPLHQRRQSPHDKHLSDNRRCPNSYSSHDKHGFDIKHSGKGHNIDRTYRVVALRD